MIQADERIEAQPRQRAFLGTSADIAFFGGAAGGGKTYSMIMEPLRYIKTVPGMGAVFFRRTYPQITAEGGPWDESYNLYPNAGGVAIQYEWTFPPFDNRISFSHMSNESDVYNWKSAQIPLILFDQMEDFTRKQFFYMLSRNRSTCGVRPYVRGSYNPVPSDDEIGGWIHEFVSWYLDDNLEYPDESKAGVIRWFVNVQDKLHWYDSRAAAVAAWPDIPPKSFTFIPSSVYDNPLLLERDPGYLANLHALDNIDMERLLKSNHKIRPEAGTVFKRSWFEIVDSVPPAPERDVRFWDFAATERKLKDNAATASVRMVLVRGTYYVVDMTEEWIGPGEIDDDVYNLATQDGKGVQVRWEEEGGASGKKASYELVKRLAGWDASGVRPSGDKLTRIKPLASQAKIGNIKLLRGDWNERFLTVMHATPDGLWDIRDAASGAFSELSVVVYQKPRAVKYA